MFNVIFAVARTVGWTSNWLEMMNEVPKKIGRPRQLYTGSRLREFVKLEDRSPAARMRVVSSSPRKRY